MQHSPDGSRNVCLGGRAGRPPPCVTLRAVQLWTAFQQAGWVGKVVLAILLIFSVASWAVMFVVWQRFRRSQRASRRFVGMFRKAKRLADVQAGLAPLTHAALVGLFRAGYAEI
jgi:biopolymer transport protein TolQ